jgi:hypothetical protein
VCEKECIYIYIYMYIYVCVCVCVCAKGHLEQDARAKLWLAQTAMQQTLTVVRVISGIRVIRVTRVKVIK